MTGIRSKKQSPPPPKLDREQRRFLEEAQLRALENPGAAEGALTQFVERLEQPNHWDSDGPRRLARAQEMLDTPGVAQASVLGRKLAELPEPLRRLWLEIDAVWGNANGHVSPQEFKRVAGYYLAAAPFFTDRLKELAELADHLGMTEWGAELRAKMSEQPLQDGAPTEARKWFDAAIAESDLPGRPQALRDPAFHSPRFHQLGILEHSAFAVHACVELCTRLGRDWKDPASAMLVHDVGKLLAYSPGLGSMTFHDHDEVGAAWLKEQGAPDSVVFTVLHHEELRTLSTDELERQYDKDTLSQMLIVLLADQAAKGNSPDMVASFESQVPKVLEISALVGFDGPALVAQVKELRNEVAEHAVIARESRRHNQW